MDNVIIIAQVERERQAQGLPAKVADGTALRRIACLVTAVKEAARDLKRAR